MSALDPGFPELMLPQLHDPAQALSAITEWVMGGKAEDLYLDFTRKKSAGSGLLETDDKRAYAKALSGFANSDGGLLVWGVVAERDKDDPESADVAKDVDPVSPLDVFLGELNKVVHYSTKPAVAGVQNIAVPENEGANRGYVVSYVPAGTNPPYRAENENNNNYYKRAGSSFYRMEPYDIRDVVFRFRYPKVELQLGYKAVDRRESADIYALRLDATNHGPTVLRGYKIEVTLPEKQITHSGPTGIGSYWSWGSPFREQGVAVVTLSMHTTNFRDSFFEVYPDETTDILDTHGDTRVIYVVIAKEFSFDILSVPVTARVLGPDMPPVVVTKPFGRLQERYPQRAGPEV
jgi:hypothetical protein